MSSTSGNAHPAGNGAQRPEDERSKFAPRPAVERRRRRDDVARMLLEARPSSSICEILSGRHGVSPSTIKADIRFVLHRWAREDGREAQERRSRVIRRLERLAVNAEKRGEFHAAIRANLILAKIVGLILPPSVQVAIQNTVNVGERDDEAAELLRQPEVADSLSSAFERRAEEERRRLEGGGRRW